MQSMYSEEITPEEALNNIDSNIKRNQRREKDLTILDELTHRSKSRRFFKSIGYEELCQVKEIIDCIMIEREAEQEIKKEREKEKEKLREKISTLLIDHGFTADDLYGETSIDGPVKPRRKYSAEQPTAALWYKVEAFGLTFYWSGRGATPLIFKYVMRRDSLTKHAFKMPEPVENGPNMKRPDIPPEHMAEVRKYTGKI